MFLRIFVAIMILSFGTYYVVYFYSDSLTFLTNFNKQHSIKAETPNFIPQTSENKKTQTIITLEIPKQAEEFIPEVSRQDIQEHRPEYVKCREALGLINSIVVKFFENQSCHYEVMQLKSFDQMEVMHKTLDELDGLCELETENLIKNRILSKMLQVKKFSRKPYRKMRFLAKIDKIQVYFYSGDFMKLCK